MMLPLLRAGVRGLEGGCASFDGDGDDKSATLHAIWLYKEAFSNVQLSPKVMFTKELYQAGRAIVSDSQFHSCVIVLRGSLTESQTESAKGDQVDQYQKSVLCTSTLHSVGIKMMPNLDVRSKSVIVKLMPESEMRQCHNTRSNTRMLPWC